MSVAERSLPLWARRALGVTLLLTGAVALWFAWAAQLPELRWTLAMTGVGTLGAGAWLVFR